MILNEATAGPAAEKWADAETQNAWATGCDIRAEGYYSSLSRAHDEHSMAA